MRAGVIHIEQHGFIKFQFVVFEKNKAYHQAGVLYASTYATFYMDTCELNSNWANESSTINLLKTSSSSNITLDNTIFFDNEAE